MKIPGRARCNCFLVNYIHNAKAEKFNRDEYILRERIDRGCRMKIFYLSLWGLIVLLELGAGLSCTDVKATDPSEAISNEMEAPASVDSYHLLLTGNWMGKLEPCGCTDIQMGGINRRTKEILKAAPDPQSRLMLDTGSLIAGYGRQARLKFGVFLASLRELKYDAISIPPREILLLPEMGIERQNRPNLIVSNLGESKQGDFGCVRSLKKTLRVKDRKLECLVFALNDPEKKGMNQLEIKEPLAEMQKLFARNSIDPDKPSVGRLVVVMLPDAGQELIKKIREIAAIDILVVPGIADEPEIVTGAQKHAKFLTVTTGRMGKYIVHIEIPEQDKENPAKYKFHPIVIDSRFEHDPNIDRIINDYQEMLKELNLIAEDNGVEREALEGGNFFAGNKACSQCHKKIYNKWKKFKHGHAMATLQKVNRAFDPECVVCHSVGMKYESGYRSLKKTPELADVGCEMCHGPGGHHIDDPMEEYQNVFAECESCHTHDQSPGFEANRKKYFEKIRHWKKEPRIYWD